MDHVWSFLLISGPDVFIVLYWASDGPCKTRENFIFSEKGQNSNFAEIVQTKT